MKVSVIIPAYNEEKCILKIISSLLFQSYDNYDVIIVDNNSTDSTWIKMVNYFNSLYPKNVINEEDKYSCDIRNINFSLVKEYRRGTNNAREKGRSIATGNILAFVDSDCQPSYHWISNGVKLLKDKNVTAATGAYYFYDDKSLFRRNISLYTQILLYKPISYILQYFNKGAILIGGNMFIDAHIFDELDGFNTELSFYGDDTDTANRLSKCGKIKFSSLINMPTSSRRFKELGYAETNKKYISIFLKMVFGKSFNSEQSKEVLHPR
jgi:glycosyltransferase involved in cell wall biosynthesis